MQEWNTFILIAVALPIVAALLNYIVPRDGVRKVSVFITTILLVASSIWLMSRIGSSPVYIDYQWADKIILFLDLAILVYVTYVAIERRHITLFIMGILQLAGIVYLEMVVHPDASAIASLVIDRLSVVMFLVVAIVGSLICIYALKYMEEHEHHVKSGRNGRFFLWFIIFLGAMNGLIFSNNLFWLYFFWECTTLCSFMLIGHDDTEEARANSLRALFLNSIGGLAMVGGLFILVTQYGGAGVSLMSLVNGELGVMTAGLVAVLALFSLGGFTKAAQFPFQSWLLGAMVAPTPVSALLHSSTMVKAGVYMLVRLAPAYQGLLLSTVIALIGAFTFFAASLMAVGEDNGKRVLAYSTIANLGLIIACAGINTPLSLTAAVLLIIFHAVSKAMLFMGVGAIEHTLGSRNIEKMEGLAVKMPGMAVLMGIGVFTMFLPPFGMLFAKWAGMEAAVNQPILLILFVAASALTALFWAKWMGRMVTSLPGEEKIVKPARMSGYYSFSLGTLAAGAVLLSLGIGWVLRTLVIPAELPWYPQAFASLKGSLVSLGASGAALPIGVFPLALLFIGVALTVVLPLIFPPRGPVGNVYLSGANIDEPSSGQFIGVMDTTSELALGGYYYKNVINEKLTYWFNIVAILLIALMMGVVAL